MSPFADASRIVFRLAGADSLSLSSQGDLVSRLGPATFTLKKPLAYQEYGKRRKFIEVKYSLSPGGTVHFKLGKYDSSKRLVIDPVLVFSTYLGGTAYSAISSVTTDATGNVYVAGTTRSTGFPTANPEQPACSSCTDFSSDPDVFVSELDPTGHTLLFSTYLGGSGIDNSGSIAITPDGSIIVSGLSASTDFPLAGQAASDTCHGSSCFFLTSFKPGGASLNFSGIYGGSDSGGQNGPNPASAIAQELIAVDTQGNIYLSGESSDSAFQFTSGVLDSAPLSSVWFIFVMKVSNVGQVTYSTAIPNDNLTALGLLELGGIVVDANGQVTIAGTAGPGMPTTSGAMLSTVQNSLQMQGFILQLNADATALNFATYVPGVDYVQGLTTDSTGNYLLAGTTEETHLQVSVNAYQASLPQASPCPCQSGFVLKLDPQAQSVLGGTYFSSSQETRSDQSTNLLSIAVDSHSNIFVGGVTWQSNFPLKNPLISQQHVTNWAWGPIVAELSPDFSTLEFSTYINGFDIAMGGAIFGDLAVDSQGNLIVVGSTGASYYPTTPGSIQPTNPGPAFVGTRAGFITKVNVATPAGSPCFSSVSLNFSAAAQTTTSVDLPITNCGNAPLEISNFVSGGPAFMGINPCGPIAPGDTCAVQIDYTPLTYQIDPETALTFRDDAGVAYTVWVSGTGVASVIQPSPSVIDFGPVLVGGSPGVATLDIVDGGNGTLLVESATVTGSNFSVVGSSCVGTIDHECNIKIAFSPTTIGSEQGTVQIVSNDPIHPTLNVPLNGVGVSANVVPIVSSISPLSTPVGSAPFTLQVTGVGFSPASIIEVNGHPLTTTYIGDTSLSAAIASSFLGNVTELEVTVVTPAPGGRD